MSVIQEILERLRHEQGLGEARRASLEYELYELTDDPTGKKSTRGDRPEFLRKTYDLSFYEMKHRLTLYLAGPSVEPYWRLLDEKSIALSTAVRLHREARRRAQSKGTSIDVEIEEGLMSWEDRTVAYKNKTTGRTYRRRADYRSTPSFEDAVRVIRECARGYADRKAVHLDMRIKRRIVDEMMAEVDAVLASLLLRIQREDAKAAQTKAPPQATRREIVEACEALHIRPPTPTKPIDMDEVTRKFRELVKKYHPDVTGNEVSRGIYEQVVRARDTLRRYVEEQKEKKAS